MTLAEQAKDALDAAFAREIAARFAMFNAWKTSGEQDQHEHGDPVKRLRISMTELKAAFEEAHVVLDEIFGAIS